MVYKKKKTKYWIYKVITECADCGYRKVQHIKMTTKKPDDKLDRFELKMLGTRSLIEEREY